MGVLNDYTIPPPPEPNPYPFSATIPQGAPGEHVPLFKVTAQAGADLDLVARVFQYVVEIEAMFAGAGEDPERLVTAFGVYGTEVSRVAGYHNRRELTAAHWDGTGLVVSIVRDDAVSRTYTGFLTSRRLTHGTTITMLA
jgi:hypothetical protein